MPRYTKNSSAPVVPNPEPVASTMMDSVVQQDNGVTLFSLSSKLDVIMERLNSIDTRFLESEKENKNLKQKVSELEERVEHLEAAHRRDNIILSGNLLAELPNGDDCSGTVVDLLKRSVNYVLDRSKLLTAYRLGSKPSNQSADRRNVLVKLAEHDMKRDIIAAFRTVKPSSLYVNDDLTPLKASILFTIRQAKKKLPDRVAGCGSRDGRVYILFRSPNPNARHQRVFVRSEQQFDELCVKTLGMTSEEIRCNGSRH